VLACGLPASGAKPPKLSYQIHELDLVDQQNVTYPSSQAVGINSQGQVVGGVRDAFGRISPAYWTTGMVAGKVQSTLSLLVHADDGVAEGINDHGEIVGAGLSDGQSVGLYWANHAAMPQHLQPLEDDDDSWAVAINKNGVICGCSMGWTQRLDEDGNPMFDNDGNPIMEGHRWTVVWRVTGGVPDGVPVELPGGYPQPPSDISDNDIHNHTKVAGTAAFSLGGARSAWVWTVLDGDETLAVVDATVLNDVGNAYACGVNNDGAVCGIVSTETTHQAVVWSGGSTQTLNVARFFYTPGALDINNKGMIVGFASDKTTERAVMWSDVSASMVVLDKFLERNSPFGILCFATAVNDSGAIVGIGWNGAEHTAFLSVPK
jgi:uncharacterized membrane protein